MGARSPALKIAGEVPAAEVPAKDRGLALPAERLREVPIDAIIPDPDQPRKDFDSREIADLAKTIEQWGQLQPCEVYWSDQAGRYVLIFGERRFRAALLARRPTLRCVILDGRPDESSLRIRQLVENLARSALGPIEEAKAFREAMDRDKLSQSELARRLAISQPRIAKALALLKLPEEIREIVADGKLDASTAYELTRLPDPEDQRTVAKVAVAADLSRAEVACEIDAILRGPEAPAPSPIYSPRIDQGRPMDLGGGILVEKSDTSWIEDKIRETAEAAATLPEGQGGWAEVGDPAETGGGKDAPPPSSGGGTGAHQDEAPRPPVDPPARSRTPLFDPPPLDAGRVFSYEVAPGVRVFIEYDDPPTMPPANALSVAWNQALKQPFTPAPEIVPPPLGDRPRPGRYRAKDLGLSAEDLDDSYTAHTVARQAPTLGKILLIRGFFYACMRIVAGKGGGYDAHLLPLFSPSEFKGPTFARYSDLPPLAGLCGLIAKQDRTPYVLGHASQEIEVHVSPADREPPPQLPGMAEGKGRGKAKPKAEAKGKGGRK